MFDHDVVVPESFPEIIADVAANGYDFVASHLRKARPTWQWTKTAKYMAFKDDVIGALLMVFGASAKGIEAAYGERKRIWQLIKSQPWELDRFPRWDWPFCEVLLPNVLRQENGFRAKDILDYGNVSDFSDFRVATAQSVFDERLYAGNKMVHPVLMPLRALEKIARATEAEVFEKEVYDGRSHLRHLIAECLRHGDDFLPLLLTLFSEKVKDTHRLLNFIDYAYQEKWGDARGEIDLAAGGKASQSSTYGQMTADKATNGNKRGHSGSMTTNEVNPWWQIDLEDVFKISQIKLWHETNFVNQTKALYLLASEDGERWQELAYLPVFEFELEEGHKVKTFEFEHLTARYVKVQLKAETILRFDEIEIFGGLAQD
jgi:hypothetical protein